MRLRHFLGFTALLVSACENPLACNPDTETLEAEFSSPFYNVTLSIVQGYEEQGYDCDSESIRDSQGRSIGTRYTCTKCG